MPRFTISRHTGSKEGDHYDLMIEEGEALKTWRIATPSFQAPQAARQIKDHRKLYLEYEGEISDKRGTVRIWDTGVYAVDVWDENRIQIAVVGRVLRTRLRLERGKEDAWTVSDATGEVRKIAAALLRGEGLGEAPTPELDELRTALAHEEQRIMAVVDQFARGGTVEWSLAEIDSEVVRKIESQKARWQHPWLAAAKAHAEHVAELAAALRRQRPAGRG